MENILDVYAQPYDPKHPLICMDEQPFQMLDHILTPLPMKPGSCEKIDYEYERKGTCSIFMFTEPLQSWRHTSVREQRTRVDWAKEIDKLLTVEYPDAEKVVLVMDNLNTHTIGSLYQAFAPEKARELAKRLEIHYTPKHGSWLNVAEIELSVMTRQCLGGRIPDLETLRSKLLAWEKARNKANLRVRWQFSTADARIKLKHLYPKYDVIDSK